MWYVVNAEGEKVFAVESKAEGYEYLKAEPDWYTDLVYIG